MNTSGFVRSLRDIIISEFRIRMPAAVARLGRAIKPIYSATPNGRATHLGTCILIKRKHNRFLLTAGHIIDVRLHSQLLIPVSGKLTAVTGNGIMTTPPKGGRRLDRFDFAAIALEPNMVHGLNDLDYISEPNIYVGDWNTSAHMYVAIGYPNSRNERTIDHKRGQIKPAPFSYGANVIRDEALSEKLGITGNDHLIIKYDKRSRDVNGSIVNSISPTGMSGGALIDMGSTPTFLTTAQSPVFRLAGLLIENHRSSRRIVAVKIDTVNSALDDAVNEGKLTSLAIGAS